MLDSRYALLTTIVLGIAHMCMFVGYDEGSFIVESVLHSVHDRKPDEMNEHAGYYGQAIVNAFNMVGHIVAPAILCVINAKGIVCTRTFSVSLNVTLYGDPIGTASCARKFIRSTLGILLFFNEYC